MLVPNTYEKSRELQQISSIIKQRMLILRGLLVAAEAGPEQLIEAMTTMRQNTGLTPRTIEREIKLIGNMLPGV